MQNIAFKPTRNTNASFQTLLFAERQRGQAHVTMRYQDSFTIKHRANVNNSFGVDAVQIKKISKLTQIVSQLA